MPETPLARVRRLCLSFPGTSEKTAWGAPTFRVGKTQKMFAAFSDDDHGHGHVALWCHAPKGKKEVLVMAEPERVFDPPYVGKSGWIGLVLSRHRDAELLRHLRDAFLVVAPKKLAHELDGDGPE